MNSHRFHSLSFQAFNRFTRLLAVTFFAAGVTLSTQAADLGERQVAPNSSYSIQAPSGWTVTKDPAKISVAAKGKDGMNLESREVVFPGTSEELANASMEALDKRFPEFKKISSGAFQSTSGLKGLEIVFEHRVSEGGPKIRQAIFFYDGRPGHKVFITCGVLAENFTTEAHELFRQVAASIQLEKANN